MTLFEWISKSLLLSIVFASSVALSNSTSPWNITEHSFGVRYIVNGENIYGHQFGFIKLHRSCQRDLFWLSLSSYEQSLLTADTGVITTIRLSTSSAKMDIQAELLNVGKFTDVVLVATFSNSELTPELQKFLSNSEKITVKILSPSGLVKYFDINEEIFLIPGLTDARSHAEDACMQRIH